MGVGVQTMCCAFSKASLDMKCGAEEFGLFVVS